MQIKPFKIKVTPEQSRIVQNTLFDNDYYWSGYNHSYIQHTDKKYLSFDIGYDFPKALCYISNKKAFELDQVKEITFEEFLKTYATKEYRKLKLQKLQQLNKKTTKTEELINYFEKFFKK